MLHQELLQALRSWVSDGKVAPGLVWFFQSAICEVAHIEMNSTPPIRVGGEDAFEPSRAAYAVIAWYLRWRGYETKDPRDPFRAAHHRVALELARRARQSLPRR